MGRKFEAHLPGSSERVRIEHLQFTKGEVDNWRDPHSRHQNWPVVYLLSNDKEIYVGETSRARARLRQHLDNQEKRGLTSARIVINEEFNKSACLDLESRLISWLHADAQYVPLNRNDGQQNSNYFERATRYQEIFDEVFALLHAAGVFHRTVPEIENLNLFKLSPYKALNDEQMVAVEQIVEGLFRDLGHDTKTTSVVQGGPGTGKTIVAIYLLKLLRDIQNTDQDPELDEEGRFSDFFFSGYRELIKGIQIGFVVPQQSLRKTIARVFRQTPGMGEVSVLSPYTVANSREHWDLLVVDETHRLTFRGSGPTRRAFESRNKKLFGDSSEGRTAIDWIQAKSDHQVFLLDGEQSVRPADVPGSELKRIRNEAKSSNRFYVLESQMRVAAGNNYLEFASQLLTGFPIRPEIPKGYDLRFFENLADMRREVLRRNSEVGLSRLVAGYAWKWQSKGDLSDDAPYDIEIDGLRLRWNRTDQDWIASEGSEFEVGSVHTTQGYDLNFAGVIIGPDIVWNEKTQQIEAVRESHFDREVRSVRDPERLLELIRNAYYVLLTRGMRGTYVYVRDLPLRARLRTLFES